MFGGHCWTGRTFPLSFSVRFTQRKKQQKHFESLALALAPFHAKDRDLRNTRGMSTEPRQLSRRVWDG